MRSPRPFSTGDRVRVTARAAEFVGAIGEVVRCSMSSRSYDGWTTKVRLDGIGIVYFERPTHLEKAS